MKVDVKSVGLDELRPAAPSEYNSASMREKVNAAFGIQKNRYRHLDISFNSALDPTQIQTFCPLTRDADALLQNAFQHFDLSARGYHKLLKVARTIADLDGSEMINEYHLSEALCFRYDMNG